MKLHEVRRVAANLTRAQRIVLGVLADVGPRETSNRTVNQYVAGSATAALWRKGLVELAPQVDVERWEDVRPKQFRITAAGRRALRRRR